jgi:hypothetical protein
LIIIILSLFLSGTGGLPLGLSTGSIPALGSQHAAPLLYKAAAKRLEALL